MNPKHPMQPLVVDKGVIRFKGNAIVQALVDNGVVSLNDIRVGNFPVEDVEQFWQLLGYSVSGYGDLSFIREERVNAADAAAELLREQMAKVKP